MARKKAEAIPEESLAIIHQVACAQMCLSDAYYFLACYYRDKVMTTGFGACVQDKAVLRWFDAKTTLRYITTKGSQVCLPSVQMPAIDNQGCIQCLTSVLNMEKELTKILKGLHATALKIRDMDTLNFVRELMPTQRKNEKFLAQELAVLEERGEQAQEEEEDETRL